MSKINVNMAGAMDKTIKIAVTAAELYLIGRWIGVIPKKKKEVKTFEGSYSGAIQAITTSSILDSYKKDIIDIMKKDADSDYYKSVIAITQSWMLDSYKLDAIKAL